MRLFVAIGARELDVDPKVSLRKVKVALEQKKVEHRWVPQENYHVTLNFIGEVEEHGIGPILEALRALALTHGQFSLKVEGVSAFPNERAGRVLWLGVQNSVALRALQSDCEVLLRGLGLAIEEREYRPHLTVGRLRNPRNLTDILSPVKKLSFGKLRVEKVCLYESKQGGAFPVYESIEEVPLMNR